MLVSARYLQIVATRLANSPKAMITADIGPSTNAPETMCTMANWILECLSSHTMCGIYSRDRRLPKRVIDVGDGTSSDTLILTDADLGKPYVCLSYCWGKATPSRYQLQRSTVSSFEQSIPEHDLPATVRDAAVLVRNLGIRYLWVDALCIIQDDLEDWLAESPYMGDIYHNALFTIAATSSEHADVGLIRPRVAEMYKLTPCQLFGQVLGRPPPNLDRSLDDTPIMRRAWTTQELYLSRRILHITSDFAAWECRSFQALEPLPCGIPCEEESICGFLPLIPYSVSKEQFLNDAEDPVTIYEAWHRLVMEYSARNLTRDEDILVAVSSLANKVKEKAGDEYLAGLWRGNLQYDLLWQSDESRSRAETYTAPSWTWASTHNRYRPQHSDARHTSISFNNSNDDTTFLTTVESANVQYANDDDRSIAKSGKLRLSGRLSEGEFSFDGMAHVHGMEGFFIIVDGFNALGDPSFDTNDMTKFENYMGRRRTRTTESQLYCLAMTRRDKDVPAVPLMDKTAKQLQVFERGEWYWHEAKVSRSSARRWSCSALLDPTTQARNDWSPYKAHCERLDRERKELEGNAPLLPILSTTEQGLTDFCGANEDAGAQDREEAFDNVTVAASNPIQHEESLVQPADGVSEEQNVIDPGPYDGRDIHTDLLELAGADGPPPPFEYPPYMPLASELFPLPDLPSLAAKKPDPFQELNPYPEWDPTGKDIKRRASVDSEKFERWYKQYEKVRSKPQTDEEIEEARVREQMTWVEALILEKVGLQEVDGDEDVFRRVGFAHLEIREGKTQALEEFPVKQITII